MEITQSDLKSALPDTISDVQTKAIGDNVSIIRDTHGIPHVSASSTYDAFFGQGFATAPVSYTHLTLPTILLV